MISTLDLSQIDQVARVRTLALRVRFEESFQGIGFARSGSGDLELQPWRDVFFVLRLYVGTISLFSLSWCPSSTTHTATRRRPGGAGGGAFARSSANSSGMAMLRFFTDEAPGIKVTPVRGSYIYFTNTLFLSVDHELSPALVAGLAFNCNSLILCKYTPIFHLTNLSQLSPLRLQCSLWAFASFLLSLCSTLSLRSTNIVLRDGHLPPLKFTLYLSTISFLPCCIFWSSWQSEKWYLWSI